MKARTSQIFGVGLTALSLGFTALPGPAFAGGMTDERHPGVHVLAGRPFSLMHGALRHAPGANYGFSVGISGGVAVVGAPGQVGTAGSAYVYVRSGKAWHLRATLKNPSIHGHNNFGWSVAVTSGRTGSYVLIGCASGDAYVFVKSGGRWHLQAKLADPHPTVTGGFGSTVAIVGAAALVGAPDQYSPIGRAYLYARAGSRWRLRSVFRQTDRHKDSYGLYSSFGWSVALTRTTAVIGDLNAPNYRGEVFIYDRHAATWFLQAKITDPHRAALDDFGDAVAISAATAVIGTGGRQAYVFARSGRRWHLVSTLTEPHGPRHNQFGNAVAIDGTRVLVGDPRPSNRACATAYEFRQYGRAWKLAALISNPGCKRNDWFGGAVALSSRTAVIGAPELNNWAGTAYWITLP